jgi:hypothetical protein
MILRSTNSAIKGKSVLPVLVVLNIISENIFAKPSSKIEIDEAKMVRIRKRILSLFLGKRLLSDIFKLLIR